MARTCAFLYTNLFISYPSFFPFSLVCYDVRHAGIDAHNELRLGSGNAGAVLVFKDLLKPLFSRTVYNPASWLRVGFPRDNLCVLAASIMILNKRLGQTQLRNLTKAQMSDQMGGFNTAGLYAMSRVGLGLADLTRFEKLNSPIPVQLLAFFPKLTFFHGISVNIFHIKDENNTFRLFPLALYTCT